MLEFYNNLSNRNNKKNSNHGYASLYIQLISIQKKLFFNFTNKKKLWQKQLSFVSKYKSTFTML